MDETIAGRIHPAPQLRHDGTLWISTARDRFAKVWKARETSWSSFLGRLVEPTRTQETLAEYLASPKAAQDKVKDVGGFVGGTLKDGRRGSGTVTGRWLLTLDLDNAPEGYDTEGYTKLGGFASAIHSTHKHMRSKPRLRLLVPLSRMVNADEYEAVARMVGSDVGMQYMDPTTFQPSRLMYWPSCSSDGEYVFRYTDAPFLDPDTVLARYPDWTDISQWPSSEGETRGRKALAKKQEDPTGKKGVVGAFCRAHDVADAIAQFLPEIYVATDKEDRYSYAPGSTSGGLVIYGDGKWAYSNHGTDPASGRLLNAFDLVRVHLFSEEDDGAAELSPTNRLPSYKHMLEFAMADEETSKLLFEERKANARQDFDDDADPDAWLTSLERKGAKGELMKSVLNCERIFRFDPGLAGIRANLLSGGIEVDEKKPVPWERLPGQWSDVDDAQLYAYVAKNYAEFPRNHVEDQKKIRAVERRFHPVIEYLESLPLWDGEPRLDSLLIDYLGAEDSVYTREATAKTILAAISRVYDPGCKFDNVLVIAGPQGCGKSTLVERLAGEWYSDSLAFEDMRDKTAAEKVAGYWMLEIPEMKGMAKMDVESIKSFISRRYDIYRPAYAKNTIRCPRQCIFFGTVNDSNGYLRDITGNRRFWPVPVTGKGKKKPWEISEENRAQIWAEAWVRYTMLGETSLLLSPAAERIASGQQARAMESDDREGLVGDYLSIPLPDDWAKRDLGARLAYLDGDFEEEEGHNLRAEVTNIEIWCECFRRKKEDILPKDSYLIAGILKRLGWERQANPKRVKPYGLQRWYARGNTQ